MSETAKLRSALDDLETHTRMGPHPEGSLSVHRDVEQRLLARVFGQVVFALEEQIASYQAHIKGAEIVQCKVCHGTGRGVGFHTSDPCGGCSGSGLVRV